MPASKKRIKLRSASTTLEQKVPAALRDWVHIWHGVRVQSAPTGGAIFHAGSRHEELSFWQQFVRLPASSLFPRVETHANPRRQYKDFLYVLLNLRWPVLFTVLLGVFITNIFAFAVVTCYGCGEPATFLHAFDLSYQTFTTIGFGVVFPQRTCSNIIMTLESFASMLVTSAITGLVFAKFAKPIAKIAFSKVCVVQPYGAHHLALVVRVANATQSRDVTHDVIMEANFKLNLLRIESTESITSAGGGSGAESLPRPSPHGAKARDTSERNRQDDHEDHESSRSVSNGKSLRSYNLKVLQNNFITFRMGVAIVHVIDAESPFFGLSERELLASDMILEVAMSGVDSTLQDTVAERMMYTASDFKWGYRFAELLDFDERNMEVIMDFAKLSAIEPAPIDADKYVRPAAAAVAVRTSAARATTAYSDGNDASRVAVAAASTTALAPIDELGAEDPEVFRRQRSVSDGSSIAQHVLKRAPSKCSLAMEPLFEPLLQRPVGTQRLPHQTPSAAGSAADKAARRTRLTSGPSAHERSGDASTIGEFIIPMPQKRQIQSRLAGEAEPDDDGMSTVSDLDVADASVDVSDDDDGSDDNAERDAMDVAYEALSDELTPRGKRSSFTRQRSRGALSAVSIDVEDTPRFLKISPLRIPKSYDFMRLYHSALYVRWPRIICVFVFAFVALNTVFGVLYWLKAGDMAAYPEMTVSTFELAFFMSVHTLATIGYGSVAPRPQSLYMNFWVLVESSLGIIAVTIITGIAWSKFARPRAHIHFSSKVALCRIYGHRCLVFRAANTRHSGDVHENFFRIGVILTNRKTGLRQMYDVPLVTAEWPSIKLPATLIHIIDATSPFYKFHSVADLSASRVAVIALLTGLDTTFSENVYARKMYFWDDFTCNQRFADFARVERDRVVVDYERFDALEPEVSASRAAPQSI